jgi:hypothetical protein
MGSPQTARWETATVGLSLEQVLVVAEKSGLCLDSVEIEVFKVDEGILLFTHGGVVRETKEGDVVNSIFGCPLKKVFTEGFLIFLTMLWTLFSKNKFSELKQNRVFQWVIGSRNCVRSFNLRIEAGNLKAHEKTRYYDYTM